MGQYLSFPSTEKHCESGSNGRLFYGLAEMQGWRISMEDAHAAVLDLDGPEESSNAFFAVYDGHGGSAVAKFAATNVHKRLVAEGGYKDQNWELALKKAFLGTDEDFLAEHSKKDSANGSSKANGRNSGDSTGCTAIAALVTNNNKIYVANAGDSRSVLSVKGKAEPLSFDHTPTKASERARISQAGGYITEGRVNGSLAMTRALGDFLLKGKPELSPEAQVLTADPEVICHEVTEEDEFLVLACDGIWDCLSSQQVVDFVRYQVSEGNELTQICETILDHCLAPDTNRGIKGCDNMTLLLVGITHGRTKKQWQKWIKERVKSKHGYSTPEKPPQLYPPSRLRGFQERIKANEAQKARAETLKAKKAKEEESKARRERTRSRLQSVAAVLMIVAVAVAYLPNLVGKLWQGFRKS